MFKKALKSKLIIYLIFLLISLVPFLWFSSQIYNKFFYIGSGDFISPIDIKNLFFYRSFVYNPFQYGGTDVGFLIAGIFPENTLYYILNLVQLTPLVISLLYISIIIFLSEISMYYFILYSLENKLNLSVKYKYFFAFIAGVMYGFSPYLMGLLPPGHFRQLIPYSLFPLLLIIYDKILKTKRFNFRSFIYLFIIFLFSASSFGNIGIIYVFMLTLAIYTFLMITVDRLSIIKGISSFFSVVLILITSNIWWISSFINSFKLLANPGAKLSSSNLAVGLAVQKATIINFFLGKPEYQLYLLETKYYINGISSLIFILLSIFLIIAIIKLYKKAFVSILLVMTLLGIFISKGPREPFGEIFMWLYNNIFGFQIFRRPVSKYYGIFMFFFIALAVFGLAITTYKLSLKKFLLFIMIPFIMISAYFVFIFAKNVYLIPFNIPSYYEEARNYLVKNEVKKVLILPGIQGLQPTYDKSINNLYTTDFLFLTWYFPFDTPVGANFATDYHKRIINPIMKKIRKGADICDLTKGAGISHIMLRHDLSLSNPFEDKPKNLSKILDNNKFVVGKKDFNSNEGKGFTIYTLDTKCTANLIQLTKKNEAHIDFQIINPTKIKISILKLTNINILKFLNNFQNNWNIYLSKYSNDFFIKNEQLNINIYPKKKIFFEGDELQFFTKKPLFEKSHKNNKSWENQWTIDPQYIKKNYPDSYYYQNQDGSINIQLILYYKTQSYLYLGLIIFGVILFVFFLYFCLLIYKKITKRSNW